MGIIIHRDNDKGVLEDQILGPPARNQFQKDAGSQSVIYSLSFDDQDQKIILYCFILFWINVSNLLRVNFRLEICC